MELTMAKFSLLMHCNENFARDVSSVVIYDI
jgi:hypothetical protein